MYNDLSLYPHFIQTWDLLLIMSYGFKGLCEDFLADHKGYFIAPIRINGSAIESIFSSLKYISGGNLSATNYATSLSSLLTQKTIQKNPHSSTRLTLKILSEVMHNIP